MKKLLIFVILCLPSLTTYAQSAYEKAMQEALIQLGKAQTTTDWIKSANQFEMISNNASKQWQPRYYASFAYTQTSYMEEEATKRDAYINKALKIWEEISEKNDEIYVLRAFIAQASMAVDGRGRFESEGAIFDEYMGKATKVNAQNPRIYYLQGTRLFNTPSMFGGGAKRAMPHFEKAKKMFETFKPADAFTPKWGQSRNEKMLDLCKK